MFTSIHSNTAADVPARKVRINGEQVDLKPTSTGWAFTHPRTGEHTFDLRLREGGGYYPSQNGEDRFGIMVGKVWVDACEAVGASPLA
jgi:hypothetical protein